MNANIKTNGRALLALSTVMLLAGDLVASNASGDEQVRIETVKFQDLNVDTMPGAEALYGRIHLAANRVCSQAGRMQQARASACAEKAEGQAVGALNLPLLTTYYRTKTGDRAHVLSANR